MKNINVIKRRVRYMAIVLLLFTIVSIIFVSKIEERYDIEIINSKSKVNNNINTVVSKDTIIHSESYIVKRRNDEETLVNLNSELKVYPASLTKLMTVLVLIDLYSDLDYTISVPFSAIEQPIYTNASVAGLLQDEELSVLDLLYGILLSSGADAVYTLINELGYSEEQFVTLMNDKAKELGMTNSYFVNATGLHHNGQFSTVSDLAVLFEEALDNSVLNQIISTDYYTTLPNNYFAEGHTFQSTLFSKLPESEFSWGSIKGGKTGYTEASGLNLATLATDVYGNEYIVITAHAQGSHETEPYHISDTIELLNSILTHIKI